MDLHSLARDVGCALKREFGHPATLLCQAPARVNLIGEHTDYNDGFVLPCAIDFHTVVAARPRRDGLIRVVALDGPSGAGVDSFVPGDDLPRHPSAPWANYVRGMAAALYRAGHALSGADLAIGGNVPQGAGLSSSASLSVAVGLALFRACGLAAPSPEFIARAAQQAEHFAGSSCGVMDPMASAAGRAGHALLLDCRSMQHRWVPLPRRVGILIVHSGIGRGLAESAYNLRRQQCEGAARHFGVAALRDLDEARLGSGASGLEPTLLRRARHVVSENTRTLEAADALAAHDLVRLGELMAASHRSMRDDFEITTPAIDHLVQILREAIGDEGGARMTGGGFGGCVVAVLPHERMQSARLAVATHYRSPDGTLASAYLCNAASCASDLP